MNLKGDSDHQTGTRHHPSRAEGGRCPSLGPRGRDKAYLPIPLLGPCGLGTWGVGGVRNGLFGAVGAHASFFASGPAATGYLSGKAKARR